MYRRCGCNLRLTMLSRHPGYPQLALEIILVSALVKSKVSPVGFDLINAVWIHKKAPLFQTLPKNRRKNTSLDLWGRYKPIVQALPPFSPGGWRAVIGLVPRASLIGYFVVIRALIVDIA